RQFLTKLSIFTVKIISMKGSFFLVSLISSVIWSQDGLYRPVVSSHTKINFSNDIKENEEINILNYDYLYNGAGVGIGDFDKNGLPDIFLAGNMVEDKLYYN